MKQQVSKQKPVRRVGKNFNGICELRQLPKGTFFRTIGKNGKLGKEIYTRESYDFSTKKYCCLEVGAWGNWRDIKGTQKVSTEFMYLRHKSGLMSR